MAGPGATMSAGPGLPAEGGSRIDALVDVLRWLPGRIVVSWAMGGGLVAGGFLVAVMTLANRMSSGGIFQLSLLLFGLGAGAGIAHGGLLAYLSRDPAHTRTRLFGVLIRSLPWVIPGLAASWAAAFWISLTAAVLRSSALGAVALAGILVAWLFGLIVCGWAAWEGLRGLSAAWRRWPDLRIASLVISVVFAGLATAFLTLNPRIWWTDVRMTGVAALIIALGATIWIALPVVIAGLAILHRLTGGR